MIKLITIDVDGTLVTPLKRLTKKNKEAIKKAKKEGIHIALVSGRPFTSMIHLIEELDLAQKGHFTICQNGSYIYDNFTRKPMFGTYQRPKDLFVIDEMLEGYKLELSSMDDAGFYTRHKNPNFYTKMDARINKLPLKTIAYEDWPEDKDFGRFLILGAASEISHFIKNMPKELKENYYPVQTAPFLIEVMNKNTNKGYAIGQMIEKLGLDMNEVMAIGNEKNDIPMLEEAGFAVAMGNAVEELKVHADFITKSNLNSGVGYAIERLIENGKERYF